MLSRIAEKSYLFINHELPSLYFSSILFGQVFISTLANILNIENRISMIVFRFSIMTLSYGFVFLYMRLKKLSLFSNLWVISLLVFWSLYLARLLCDVYIYQFILILIVIISTGIIYYIRCLQTQRYIHGIFPVSMLIEIDTL